MRELVLTIVLERTPDDVKKDSAEITKIAAQANAWFDFCIKGQAKNLGVSFKATNGNILKDSKYIFFEI